MRMDIEKYYTIKGKELFIQGWVDIDNFTDGDVQTYFNVIDEYELDVYDSDDCLIEYEDMDTILDYITEDIN